jgi:hypothetical protein
MSRAAVAGLLFCFLVFEPSQVISEASKQMPRYGKYICVTDRAVGFQTGTDNQRYSGKIQVSPSLQKFFVTIKKIKNYDDNPLPEPDGIVVHIPKYCFGEKTIQNLQKQWEGIEGSYIRPYIFEYEEACLSRNLAVIAAGKDLPVTTYYSTKENIFVNELHDRFWIFVNGGFVWNYTNLMGDHYMLEGRCDLVE